MTAFLVVKRPTNSAHKLIRFPILLDGSLSFPSECSIAPSYSLPQKHLLLKTLQKLLRSQHLPMASVTTVSMLNAKCFSISSPPNPPKPALFKPISLHNLPKGLTAAKLSDASPINTAAIAGAVFSALTYSDAAFAAQQIADIADGDNRGIALLLPIIPAVAWVLFNILQPALNQLNRMRSENGVVVGLGGGMLAAGGWLAAPEASAGEMGMIADAAAASSDSRGLLLLIVVAPAVLWVLYNILQPALNQINRMRS